MRQSPTHGANVSASDDKVSASRTAPVSFANSSDTKLTANTIVANVNGHPVVLDDVIGSVRHAIEANKGLSDNQREQFLQGQLRKRLHGYIQQEIVIQALKQRLPEQGQQKIIDSLEEPFQEMIVNIKSDRQITTDEELDEALSAEVLQLL